MEYRAIYTGQEDLEHGLFGRKGSQKKNHKYLLREWVNGKWKYYYTQAQIQAKKLGSKLTKKDNSQEIKSLEKTAATAKKQSNKAGEKLSKAVKDTADNAKKSVSSILKGGKKKTESSLKKLSDTATNKLLGKSNEKSSLISKGKNLVHNVFGKDSDFSTYFYGSNASYANDFGKLAVKNLMQGNTKKAKQQLGVAVDYMVSDHNDSRIKKNKAVDTFGLMGREIYKSLMTPIGEVNWTGSKKKR